jgi:hypothetical protein
MNMGELSYNIQDIYTNEFLALWFYLLYPTDDLKGMLNIFVFGLFHAWDLRRWNQLSASGLFVVLTLSS